MIILNNKLNFIKEQCTIRNQNFIKSTIYNSTKKMKNLNINPTECMQELCPKNYKTLVREIRDLTKWNYIQYSWIRKHDLLYVSFSYIILYIQHIATTYPSKYFIDIIKLTLKYTWKANLLE